MVRNCSVLVRSEAGLSIPSGKTMDDVLLEARAIWFHLAGNTEDDEEETAAGSREIKKKKKRQKQNVRQKEGD